MLTNESVWHRYQPLYVSPLYIPYLRQIVPDRFGNDVSINTWEGETCGAETGLYSPELVRIGKGVEFQKLFTDDPCPDGWMKAPGDEKQIPYRQGETAASSAKVGYCVRQPLRHEPVFYTKKAFIPQRQFWNGPAEQVTEQPTTKRHISDQFDMRSMNISTGDYEVYYNPVLASSHNRYAPPLPPTNTPHGGVCQYDYTWGMPRKNNYASMPTADSYLG